MPQIKNSKTGFIANASDADWNSGVYDTNVWALNTPNTPANAPTPAVPISPNRISSDDLAAPDNSLLEASQNQSRHIQRIVDDYNAGKLDLNAKSNNAFIQAVARAKYGRAASDDELANVGANKYGLVGSTVKDVLGRFGLLDKIPGFGTEPPKPLEPTSGATPGATGTTPTITPEQQQIQNGLTSLGKSSQDIMSQMADNQGIVSELQTRVREYKALMDQYQLFNASTNLANTEEVIGEKNKFRENKDALLANAKDKGLTMSFYTKRLNNLITETNDRLSTIQDENSLQSARDAYQQTTDAIQYNLLAGQLSDAQQLSSSLASQLYQNQNLQLNYMQLNNQVNEFQYAKLRDSIEDDRYNMEQLGMVYVPPANLIAAQLKYGADNVVTDPVTGKSWVINKGGEDNKVQWGVIGTDENGNNQYGFIDLTNQSVTSFNSGSVDGTVGGQCGEYINDLMGTSVGDTWESKMQIANLKTADFVKAPAVGDVVVFKTKMPYGHIAAVTAINGDQITITESNWNGDEKIGTRTISVSDPSITGVYRGATFRAGFTETPEITAIQNALKSIAPRLTAEQKKSANNQINQAIKSGDIEGAKQAIVSLAISSLPTEQQNKAFGRYTAIDALEDIKTELDNYQKSGGDTSLLTGSEEQIMQKLGSTTDPRLAQIASKITMAMISYRNAVSGAAFTESEAAQYEKLFPSIGKIDRLNQAKIESLKNVFALNNKSALSLVIGANNYDAIFGKSNITSMGSIEDDWEWSISPENNVIKTTETGTETDGDKGFFGNLANTIINWFK